MVFLLLINKKQENSPAGMIPLRVEMALRLQQIEKCRPVWRL